MRLQVALSLIAVSVLTTLSVLAAIREPSPYAVDLQVGLGRPVLLANQKNRVHVRVALNGRPQEVAAARRPPANVCIAIDRSSSMSDGDKMAHARAGAVQALRRLEAGDVFSVVAYDSTVQVVVPARRFGDQGGQSVEAAIHRLSPRGNTALFGGVTKCAAELRKHLDSERVNRIILLSDGQANVGPSTPAELGALGSDLMSEGISVATVGLGLHYNEDLMAELAMRSDGRHTFVEHASHLARFLDEEMGAIAAIVARDVRVKVRAAPGVRPLGILGRPADIVGGVVTAPFGKIYAGRQHFFVVEMEVDPVVAAAGRLGRLVADVEVSFRDLLNKEVITRQKSTSATFSSSPAEVEKNLDPRVMAEVAMLTAGSNATRAMQLRDQGDVAGAEKLLQQNVVDLEEGARRYNDKRLIERGQQMKRQADQVKKPAEWNQQRKLLKKTISDDPLDGLAL
jgi:Ca-activated chloride channel homolog